MINATLDIDYSDDHMGKYDSPMAQYIDVHASELGYGDEDESDGQGNGFARYGRRIYWWDDYGFHGCDTYMTVRAAETAFSDASESCYSACEKCGEKVHNDSDSWYEHEKDECEPMSRDNWEAAGNDATLGVGHIWTNQSCPAYKTLNPRNCDCRTGLLSELKDAENQIGTY